MLPKFALAVIPAQAGTQGLTEVDGIALLGPRVRGEDRGGGFAEREVRTAT